MELEMSFNCSVLSDNTFNNLDSFSINFYKDYKENNKVITKLGNDYYEIKKFKVDHLKDYICERINVTSSDKHAVELWKVNVVDEDGIKEKLKNEMKPQLLFSVYFEDELNHEDVEIVENIHIIAIIPTSTGPLKTVGEVIEEITKNLKKELKPESFDQLDIPLQHRNFGEAMDKIKQTTSSNAEEMIDNSNYWYIVSTGTPGIGKTRFGIELFNHIKQNWKPPQKWNDVHFEYLYINFKNSLFLDDYDSELDSTVILGLRIAFAFFIEKNYDISFQVFRFKALAYGNNIFLFDSVIDYCYESLKFFNKQKLFLYFHIDDFQMIDTWDAKNKTKGLFKNMIQLLAQYMVAKNKTFIQPFLSGTSPQAIAKQKTVGNISYQFVDCPLLDNASMIRVMEYGPFRNKI